MSYSYSYVIPYTADSNFDDIAVHEALQEYLEEQHMIKFTIIVRRYLPSLDLMCFHCRPHTKTRSGVDR